MVEALWCLRQMAALASRYPEHRRRREDATLPRSNHPKFRAVNAGALAVLHDYRGQAVELVEDWQAA